MVFNSVHAVATQDERNSKLTFVATNWVKCGFNLLHDSFRSISEIVRKDWIPLSQQVFKAKCKECYLCCRCPLLNKNISCLMYHIYSRS
jgi:hypothetical protein